MQAREDLAAYRHENLTRSTRVTHASQTILTASPVNTLRRINTVVTWPNRKQEIGFAVKIWSFCVKIWYLVCDTFKLLPTFLFVKLGSPSKHNSGA